MSLIFHILPKFNGYLTIKNKNFELKKNRYLTLFSTNFLSGLVVNSFQQFYFDFSGKSENIDIIELKKDTYLIILRPQKEKCYEKLEEKIFVQNKRYSLFYSPFSCYLTILGEKSKEIELFSGFSKISTVVENKRVLIYGKTKFKNQILLIVIDKEIEVLLLEEVDKLEIKGNNIVTFKDLKNSSKHGIVRTFTKTQKKSSLVYVLPPKICTQKELVPYYFFDALKQSDFDLARKYLTSTLSNVLSDEKLKDYFGDFYEVMQSFNNDLSEITLLYKIDRAKTYKIFFEENLICNILPI